MSRLLTLWALLLGIVLSLGHVWAQPVPGMLPLLGAGRPPVTATPPVPTWLQFTSGGATFPTGSSVKYAGRNIGTASSDRFLMLTLTSLQTSLTLTSVTLQVSGQSDIVMGSSRANDTNGFIAFAWAQVGTAYGTTGDFVIQYSANIFATPSISTYTVPFSNLISSTPTVAGANSGANTTVSVDVATTSGGFILAGAMNNNLSTTTGVFTGDQTYTNRAGAVANGGFNAQGDASGIATDANNTVTITMSHSSTIAVGAAAWR